MKQHTVVIEVIQVVDMLGPPKLALPLDNG